MDEVGKLFQEEEYFVPELMLAGRAMKAAMEPLRPLLAALGREARRRGRRRRGQGRPARHRQEPRHLDAGGRGLQGDRPRRRRDAADIRRGDPRAQARDRLPVGAPDRDHDRDEDDDRGDQGGGAAAGRQDPGRRRAAEREIRDRRSAPTATARRRRTRSRWRAGRWGFRTETWARPCEGRNGPC